MRRRGHERIVGVGGGVLIFILLCFVVWRLPNHRDERVTSQNKKNNNNYYDNSNSSKLQRMKDGINIHFGYYDSSGRGREGDGGAGGEGEGGGGGRKRANVWGSSEWPTPVTVREKYGKKDNNNNNNNNDDDDDVCGEGFPTQPLSVEDAQAALFAPIAPGEEKKRAYKPVACTPQADGSCKNKQFEYLIKLHQPYRENFFNEEQMQRRHHELSTQLGKGASWRKEDGPVVVMSINKGYLFLFANWACSCDANGIDVRSRTIVITGDDNETAIEVRKLGFKQISAQLYIPKETKRFVVGKDAPIAFSLGSHLITNLLGASVTADLVLLGYDVLLQDADLVWAGDPFLYLNAHPTIAGRRMDISMMDDGRRDKLGPGNAGFIVVRSNCRMKIFMKTYLTSTHFIEHGGRSDQRYWNGLLASEPFKGKIKYGIFPLDEFANGHTLKPNMDMSPRCLVLHASYTGTIFKKIRKLDAVDQWYYTKERCPHYNQDFDPFELPEGKDPFVVSSIMQVELSTLEDMIAPELKGTVAELKLRLFRLESLASKKVSGIERVGKQKDDLINALKVQLPPNTTRSKLTSQHLKQLNSVRFPRKHAKK